MLFALGAQFEKDSNHLDESIVSNIRCGFEAEFASEVSYDTCGEYLEENLQDRTGAVIIAKSYGASHNSSYEDWSVESDSSIPTAIQYPNQVEIVSPIQDVEKTIDDLGVVFELIKSHGKTAQATGLHMTFSIKDVNLYEDKFDHLKFLFLVGESYYAKFFGRVAYGYALEFLTVFKQKLLAYLYQVDKVTITPSDCAEFVRIHASQPFAGFSENIKAVGEDNKGLYTLFAAYKEASANLSDRYQSVNTQHLTKDASRIEFRLPGGAGYENKFEQCSRLMRVLANALWVSRAGMTQYNDYYIKKLTRLVLAAQEEARSDKATLNQTDTNRTFRIQTTQEGRNTVHQLMRFEKTRMQKPTATAVASFVFSGSDVKHIGVHRAINGDANEAFFDCVRKFSEAQLWSIAGAVHCIEGQEAVCDGLDRPELNTLVLAIQARPTLDFPDIRSNDPQDWSIVPRIVEKIGQLSGKSRVWASAFALNYVVMGCLQFAHNIGSFPTSDTEFKSIGQLVIWAKSALSPESLVYFKFWVWAKLDSNYDYSADNALDDLTSGFMLAHIGSTAVLKRTSMGYMSFGTVLSLARYRKLSNSLSKDILNVFPSTTNVSFIIKGIISLKAVSNPLDCAGLIVLLKDCIQSKPAVSECQSVLYIVYKTYGLTTFTELLFKCTRQLATFDGSAAADGDSSYILEDILSPITSSDIPDSAKLDIEKAIATTVNSELRKGSEKISVYDILLEAESRDTLSIPDTLHILDSATESDLETFRSSSVVAFKLARAAWLLNRSGLKLPVNKALAVIYLKNPVWFGALAAVALIPNSNMYNHDYTWLFGIKPTAFLRDLFTKADTLFPYIKRTMSAASHIDFCSLLQHVPVVDKHLAFGKDALNFLLKSLALGLMKYPWDNKSVFYEFPSYETREYTGTLLPVLDYLAGQETKHRRTTIRLASLNFIPLDFRVGDAYEGTEPGPYFNLKVSRTDVQTWRSSFAEKLSEKEPFDYPVEKPVSDTGVVSEDKSVPPEVLYKVRKYSITDNYDLTREDVRSFIDNASKDDLLKFFTSIFADPALIYRDFVEFNSIRDTARVSTNPAVWQAIHEFVLGYSSVNRGVIAIADWLMYVFAAHRTDADETVPSTLYGASYSQVLYDTLTMVADGSNVAYIPYSLLSTYTFALALKDSNPDIYRMLTSNLAIKAIKQNVRKHVNTRLRTLPDAAIDTYNSKHVVSASITPILYTEDRTPLGDYLLQLVGRSKVASEVYKLHQEHQLDSTKPEPVYPWRSAFA